MTRDTRAGDMSGAGPERRAETARRALDRLAELVADETPVDWEAEEPGAEGAPLGGLRDIERIGAAFRAVAGDRERPSDGHEAPHRPQPSFVWGHLEVLERIGGGSSGEVYRAFDTRLHRDVALKLHPHLPADEEGAASAGTEGPGEIGHSRRSARRFLAEARRLARVRHPNVIAVHGVDVIGGRVGLWCELVRGKTLEERLRAEGPLGAQEAAVIGLDLCRALAAVHAAGLVHGDVKTSNVIRDERGVIVLLDFGSGRELGAASETAGGAMATQAEPLSGTPLSLAPEVLAGEAPTPIADLYALGVLLYRLVTGAYPVSATTLHGLRQSHAQGEHAPLRDRRPDLPAVFVAAVERALAPAPRDRFASAGEMERVLAATVTGGAATGKAATGEAATGEAATGKVATAPDGARALAAAGRGAPRRVRPLALTIAALVGLGLIIVAGRSIMPRLAGGPALEVEAALYRLVDGRTEPLADGGRVAPGDHLGLEIRSGVPVHAYVLNEDDTGDLHVLFPIAGLDLQNPLAPRIRHDLPGPADGVVQDWTVTSAGGSETFLVLASREPLEELERELSGLPPAAIAGALAYPRVSDGAIARLRGVARLEPRPEPPALQQRERLAELARRFEEGAAPARDLWMRAIRLENPPQ